MPANVRDIKVRMKAVGNIQRITKTMQMIATARFQAAQRAATATKPYSQKIAELVGELSSASGEKVEHPLLKAPEEKRRRELLLVLTSNRGLCGGFNANIIRTGVAEVRGHEDVTYDVEVVGKKGNAALKFAGVSFDYLSHFEDQPKYEQVEALATRYMKAFTDGRYDAVKVLSMAFHSMSRQTPELLQLLPMAAPASANDAEAGAAGSEVDYEFSPDPETLLNELLPITVKVNLFQRFNEGYVSEQLARMVAMKQATDAAGKLKKNLTRQYNRARQTAITTELSEIIGGSAALE